MSSANDNMSMTSDELKATKKELKELKKKINKNIYTLKKTFKNVRIGNRFYKNYVEEYTVYGSGCQGTFIINAVTGEKINNLVGSIEEDLYFKVISNSISGASGPVTLFYQSPSEYELHQNLTLSDDIKNAWREKKQFYVESCN